MKILDSRPEVSCPNNRVGCRGLFPSWLRRFLVTQMLIWGFKASLLRAAVAYVLIKEAAVSFVVESQSFLQLCEAALAQMVAVFLQMPDHPP